MAILGSFGSIIFQVSDKYLYLIDSLSRKSGARTEEHQVVGGKPRVEFMAPELDTLDLSIQFHAAHGVIPSLEIERLREICQAGQVERMIFAGNNLGKFIITSVADDWNRTNEFGLVIVASAQVSFKEYL